MPLNVPEFAHAENSRLRGIVEQIPLIIFRNRPVLRVVHER